MIELKNIKAGEVFYHSVIQIFGFCSDDSESVTIINTSRVFTATSRIYNNYFKVIHEFTDFFIHEFYKQLILKVFVKLKFGKNELVIKSNNCEITVILYRLRYGIGNESSIVKKVRVLYVVSKDDPSNGEFQSDDHKENKLENALKRIDLGKLLTELLITRVLVILKNYFFSLSQELLFFSLGLLCRGGASCINCRRPPYQFFIFSYTSCIYTTK